MINIIKINEAKHICVKIQTDSFANASALYTYVLTLHKKVSMVSSSEIDMKFSFLPWFSKVRTTVPSSADLILEVTSDASELYTYFKTNSIKINKKMATSLYASLFNEYNGFKKKSVNGMVFALASELIALDAEYKLCHEYLSRRVGLCEFRLKAILYDNFVLTNNGTSVEVSVSEEELKSVSATIENIYPLLEEFFTLVNVKEVTLRKSDEADKILINLKES